MIPPTKKPYSLESKKLCNHFVEMTRYPEVEQHPELIAARDAVQVFVSQEQYILGSILVLCYLIGAAEGASSLVEILGATKTGHEALLRYSVPFDPAELN